MQITVRYGLNSATFDRPEGTTVGSLATDANIRAVLGFGDNTMPVIEGAQVGHDFVLGEADEVHMQPRAAAKGS